MNKLITSTAFAAAMALTAGLAAPAWADSHITETSVTLLLVNDISKLGNPEGRGGYSKINGIVLKERASGRDVIYVHAGDLISPSLLSGFDKGAHAVELTNLAAPDVFVPGNHEFDFGEEVFLERMGALDSTIMAANLRDGNGKGIPTLVDTQIRFIDGVKFGFVGVITDETPELSSPGSLQFASAVDTAIAQAGELRDAGADIVVAVGHTDRSQDRAIFDSGAVDLLLTGHDHDLMIFFDGRTAMVESSNEGDYVTAIDLAITVEVDGDDRDVDWWPDFRVMDSQDAETDPVTAAMVAEFEAELSSELDVEIGTTTTELDSRRASVRSQETAFGNLIADAMRMAVGADVAITNGGGIRGNKVYPAGTKLTRRDILSELPFGNSNVLLELSGADVKAALENGVSRVADGAGRFPQVSNITFDLDLSMDAGARVSNVMIGGGALDEGAMYKLSTNDFMGRGGDGYAMFKSANVLIDSDSAKLMANDVMAYVRAQGEISPVIEGRIKQ